MICATQPWTLLSELLALLGTVIYGWIL